MERKEVQEELEQKIKEGKTWVMTEHEIIMSYIFIEALELQRSGDIESATDTIKVIGEDEKKSSRDESPLKILEKKLAKGEISIEEFKEKKELIS